MPRMVVHPREPRDHPRHPGQRPQIRVETMRAGPLPERLIHPSQLLLVQFGLATRPAGTAQGLSAPTFPGSVPTTDTLAADLEFPSDARQNHSARREQTGGTAPPLVHGLEVTPGNR